MRTARGQRTETTVPGEEPDCPRVVIWLDGPEVVKEWVWSEAEWAALSEADRPLAAQRVEGIGYSLLRRYPAGG